MGMCGCFYKDASKIAKFQMATRGQLHIFCVRKNLKSEIIEILQSHSPRYIWRFAGDKKTPCLLITIVLDLVKRLRHWAKMCLVHLCFIFVICDPWRTMRYLLCHMRTKRGVLRTWPRRPSVKIWMACVCPSPPPPEKTPICFVGGGHPARAKV